jgi:hypothetical protein
VRIEAGYDIAFNCAQEVPIVLMLSVHPSRQPDLLTEHRMELSPDNARTRCQQLALLKRARPR